MDKSGLLTQHISVSRRNKDRLSNLPESLLCQIMSNLRTKDVAKSCVLSKRWRNLWRYVPAFDVDCNQFQDYIALVSFVYMFLALNKESCFQSCMLGCYSDHDKTTHMVHLKNWIELLSNRKVKNLCISDLDPPYDGFELPLVIYTCESLVYLDLRYIVLINPMSISLPFLKVIKLYFVKFADDMDVEKLISICPVLESICITDCIMCDIQLLRVCSQSLLSFKLFDYSIGDSGVLKVEIDAPKLEYLHLSPSRNGSFRIKRLESLVEAKLNILFDNDPSDHLVN